MDVLFVAPHPDDVEFACFGTLLKHKKKRDNIFYMLVTDGSDISDGCRPKEMREVMKIVKPIKMINLNLPDRKVYDIENREVLRKSLEELRDKYKISMIYSPWIGDIHQDHSVTAEEVIRVFRYNTILQYEITHSCPGFAPNFYEEITETQKKIKLKVIKIFKSQAKKRYASDEFIRNLMIFRGQESGLKYAEAFVIWRMIKNV